jgi:hypothetical protein
VFPVTTAPPTPCHAMPPVSVIHRLFTSRPQAFPPAVHRTAGRRIWNHPPLAGFILRVMLVFVSAQSAAWASASHPIPDEAGAS